MGRVGKIVSQDFSGGLQIGGELYRTTTIPTRKKSKFRIEWGGGLLDVNLRVSSTVGRLSASVVDRITREEPRN